MKSALLAVLLLFSGYSFGSNAGGQTVRLAQVSSSGKTVLIPRGFHDEIRPNEFGYLAYADRKNPQRGLIYKPAAKVRAVKVYSDSSIWIVHESYEPRKVVKGSSLLLLSENALLAGVRKLDIQRKTLVSHKDKLAQNVKSELLDKDLRLAEKKRNYKTRMDLGRPEHGGQAAEAGPDAELIDLEVWEDSGLPGEFEKRPVYKSPHAKDFAKGLRVRRFEQMAASYFNKQIAYRQKSQRGGGEKEIARLRKEKGDSWSDEYTDEELSRLLHNLGERSERRRRAALGARVFNYQTFLSGSLNLLDNENLNDRNNAGQTKYDIELGLEWFVFKKLPRLSAFSFETSFRRSQDAFTTGDYNALGTEYSAGFHLNWHPFSPPNALERNIVFVGALIRYGWANYEIPSLGEEGTYQVASFPGLRAGVKYNFSSGWGLRLAAGFENILGDRIIRDADEGQLPDRVSHLEGKLSIGLSRFF